MGLVNELSRLQLLSSRYKNKSRMCPLEITKEEERAFLIFNYIQELKIEKRNFAEFENYWNKLKEHLADYINVLESQKDNVEGLDIFEEHALDILEEIVDKMQEIEGGVDNNN